MINSLKYDVCQFHNPERISIIRLAGPWNSIRNLSNCLYPPTFRKKLIFLMKELCIFFRSGDVKMWCVPRKPRLTNMWDKDEVSCEDLILCEFPTLWLFIFFFFCWLSFISSEPWYWSLLFLPRVIVRSINRPGSSNSLSNGSKQTYPSFFVRIARLLFLGCWIALSSWLTKHCLDDHFRTNYLDSGHNSK